MPFLATLDGERVIPEQVPDQTTVECISCGGEMRPRGSGSSVRARHFYHLNGDGACSGGESEEHQKMKALVVSALRSGFEGEYSKCGPEISVTVTQTNSRVNQRRADAFLEFEREHSRYGDGLIIEVQYRNKGKQIPATTRDYLECGYSVYWARPNDFTESEFQFHNVESAFRTHSNFAYSPPPSRDVGDFSETDLHWEDPLPDCDHAWEKVDGIQFCARCQINRTYSNVKTRYLYDNMGFLGPLDRDDVPNLPEKWETPRSEDDESNNRETTEAESQHYGTSLLPHGVPDECSHYNGPDHQWQDYGWADQGKAKCVNCNVVIEKEQLPSSVTLERF